MGKEKGTESFRSVRRASPPAKGGHLPAVYRLEACAWSFYINHRNLDALSLTRERASVWVKRNKVGASIHQLAQQLRREQTDAERRLWHRPRQRRLGGFRFRRQFVIGGFIVDFCCRKQWLVEVDDGQHLERAEADRRRTELLRARGYRVLRFWDSDVLLNTKGVLEQILTTLTTPTP